MEFVLKTNCLTKKYKNINAVNKINMSIPKGSIYGFVGRNGSGKTTLIRMVTGLISPTSGDFSLYGATGKKELANARRRIAAVVETPSIYLNMSAYDNLNMQCKLIGLSSSEISKVLKTVNLSDTGKKLAKNFSLGMRQRLGIAIALLGSPDFLILDEPTNGLDPEGIVEIRELLLDLNRKAGITILVSSHILNELSKIATHYGFISEGNLVKELSAIELDSMCKKRARLMVSSNKGIPLVLSQFKSISDYKILSEKELDIFGEFDITELAIALKNANIHLEYLTQHNEDLESFYINLIGGNKND